MFNKDVYVRRRDQLRKKMGSGLVLILGNNESSVNYPDNGYHFRQDSDFLYFFGIDLPGFIGVIDIDNGTDSVFANDVDIASIIWMGPQPKVSELAAKCGVTDTHPFNKIFDITKDAICKGRKIHFTPPYRGENKMLLQQMTGIDAHRTREYASLELIHAIIGIREIKEACEIVEIEKACAIGYNMHVTAMRMCKEGVVEQEIAGAIEGIALSGGNMPSFPIILSQNGETLHNHFHGNTLQKGKMMLTDCGAESPLHYASDNTRTIPVGGVFSQKQKDIYNIVLKALDDTIAITKPGVTYQSIHLEAARIITEGLKDIGLMKGDTMEAVKAGAHAMFFPHGLGHMMGLDVHDMEGLGQIYVGYDEKTRPIDQFGTAYLRLGKELKEGFVITNEPGIYFIPALIDKWQSEGTNKEFINFDLVNKEYRDFGGIRLEDDILVTKDGSRMLGDRIPIYTDEVEKTMNE
ncbi:MAG: aminopeptidase P family protein [Bacteroidales bacterium]|jgi:Xaa-Pro aminopeptidase|nr:aminopeptidase P family protein [Bacteroidales bacterium]